MSNPDLSGASDKDNTKKGQQQKAGKLDKPVKPAEGSQSEGKFSETLKPRDFSCDFYRYWAYVCM